MAEIGHVTDETFEAEVLQSTQPVLIDFWAEWCHPCHLIDPHLKAIAGEKDGQLRILKMNLDETPDTAARLGVLSIPTLLLFVDGAEKARIVGARPKEAILAQIEPLLGG